MGSFRQCAESFNDANSPPLKERDANLVCITQDETSHLMANVDLNLDDESFRKACDNKNYIQSWDNAADMKRSLSEMLKRPLKTLIIYTNDSYLSHIRDAITTARGGNYDVDEYENFDKFNNIYDILELQEAHEYTVTQLSNLKKQRFLEGLNTPEGTEGHISSDVNDLANKMED